MAVRFVRWSAVSLGLLACSSGVTAAMRDAVTDKPVTILFIGNSFTYGGHSAVWKYRADTVTDLNGSGVGGVPALFRLFADEAGLNYRVSLETQGGKTLRWHWDNKRAVVAGSWDHVVLQDLSELSRERPGDPSGLIEFSSRFADLFRKTNARVDVTLTSSWSRPDLTYAGHGPWTGKPIAQMALDLRAAYDRAKQNDQAISAVHPVGQAFNCAIEAGIADPNPYDGIEAGKIDLWSYDHYHASAAGYYLEALTIFADITGKDPRMLGKDEKAAAELGLSPAVAASLQDIAAQVSSNIGRCKV